MRATKYIGARERNSNSMRVEEIHSLILSLFCRSLQRPSQLFSMFPDLVLIDERIDDTQKQLKNIQVKLRHSREDEEEN